MKVPHPEDWLLLLLFTMLSARLSCNWTIAPAIPGTLFMSCGSLQKVVIAVLPFSWLVVGRIEVFSENELIVNITQHELAWLQAHGVVASGGSSAGSCDICS